MCDKCANGSLRLEQTIVSQYEGQSGASDDRADLCRPASGTGGSGELQCEYSCYNKISLGRTDGLAVQRSD